jgi:hypothetical protein
MFRRRRDPDDFAAEIASHLQFEIDRLQGEGLSLDEARRRARALRQRRPLDRTLSRVRIAGCGGTGWRRTSATPPARGGPPRLAPRGDADDGARHRCDDGDVQRDRGDVAAPLPYPQADRLVSVIDDLPGVASYDVGLSQPEWLDLERSGVFDHVALAWFDENNLTGASRRCG